MKKILVQLVVFILLCLGGFVIGVVGYQDVNPSSLLIYHDDTSLSSGLVLPGKSVKSAFVATENNLAIVRVRLRTYNRMNTTHLIFRLRQKGDEQWLVTNRYALDRVPDGLLYPFGFPAIPDSKGRVYEFELQSPDGTPDNAIGVAGGYHGIAAQYVQPLPLFFGEKTISTVRDPYSVLYMGIFLVPALAFGVRKIVRSGKRRMFMWLGLLAYLLVVYTYLPVAIHSNLILYVAGAAFYMAYVSRASASVAFVTALVCLVQIPFTIGSGNIMAANRLATIVFFLFAGGGILSIGELRKRQS